MIVRSGGVRVGLCDDCGCLIGDGHNLCSKCARARFAELKVTVAGIQCPHCGRSVAEGSLECGYADGDCGGRAESGRV